MTLEPDTKDWTWVLDAPCPDCGFDAPHLDRDRLSQAIRDNATLWQVVLADDDAAVRPSPQIWSPLEYACHVRDVNVLFDQRVRRMVDEEDARFDNWDQDATAVEADYGSADPAAVAREVVESAGTVAATYDAVSGDQWQRRAVRSGGSEFTLDSFARYHLHDLVHHAHDVSHVTKRVTVASYEAYADDYRAGTAELPEQVGDLIETFAAALAPGARVLEIGSGSGRDARALEAAGLSVRRTDITPAFVRRLRADGFEADIVDPLTDDLADDLTDSQRPGEAGKYDAVWAAASLVHVRREDFGTVVTRLAEATVEGGLLHLGVKEGDGARFATHGPVAAPRHFTFWREPQLRAVLADAGWDVESVVSSAGRRDEHWLDVTARRR